MTDANDLDAIDRLIQMIDWIDRLLRRLFRRPPREWWDYPFR